MLPQLNLDIHEHILVHLSLVDSISLLLTSSSLYFCSYFWLYALKRTSRTRPLSCPHHTDLLAVSFRELRKIALRTSFIVQNWRSPTPMPTSITTITLKGQERIVSVVPGTHLVLTVSASANPTSGLNVGCWDFQSGNRLNSLVFPNFTPLWPREYWQKCYVHHCQPCTEVSGQFTLPIIACDRSNSKWSIIIVRVIHTNRSAISLEKVVILSVDVGREWGLDIWAAIERNNAKVLISRTSGTVGIAEFDLDNYASSKLEFREDDFKKFKLSGVPKARIRDFICWNGSLFLLAYNLDGSTRMYPLSPASERRSDGFDTIPPYRDTAEWYYRAHTAPMHMPRVHIPGASNAGILSLCIHPWERSIQLVTCCPSSEVPEDMVESVPSPLSPTPFDSLGSSYPLNFTVRDLHLPLKLSDSVSEVHFDDHLGIIYIGGRKPGIIYKVSYGLPEASPNTVYQLRQLYHRILRRITRT